MRPIPRYLALTVLIAMASFAAIGALTLRRDIANLRALSQDNILWTATQMEVELLRFQVSVARLAAEQTPEAIAELHERFDIVWSRVFMMGEGRVGRLIATYDKGHGSIPAFAAYLEDLDPIVQALQPGDVATVRRLLRELDGFQKNLRLYTLRVVRGNTDATALVRDRMQWSSQSTVIISLAAVLLSLLSLVLIQRENRRQAQVTEISRRIADSAELSSRAKSRFLTMMSHELRNPLNGVIGPMVLLGQSDLAAPQRRLVEQAQQSGQSMLQLLTGLLDYGEMEDGSFNLRSEPFRPADLAETLRAALSGTGAAAPAVVLQPGMPAQLRGDLDRLAQIFIHLCQFVLEAGAPAALSVRFDHDGQDLTGEIALASDATALDWKLNLLMGLSELSPDQVTSDALRPLIARGLIAATGGVIGLVDLPEGRRAIRVAIPAPPVALSRVRVHLETRSTALAAIYRAALRSDQIVFGVPGASAPADVVLVDATTIGGEPLVDRLRSQFPDALFVSLGPPRVPADFDDIVEQPGDMSRLRASILGRLAS